MLAASRAPGVSVNSQIAPQAVKDIASAASEYLAQVLHTDLGARMTLDVERYEKALRERTTLRSQRKALDKRRVDLEGDREAQANPGARARHLDDVVEELAAVSGKLDELGGEIAAIENDDPQYRLALPDSAPEGADANVADDLERLRWRVDRETGGIPEWAMLDGIGDFGGQGAVR